MKHNYTSTKTLGLAAITAIMAAAVFTSCSKDEDLGKIQNQLQLESEQSTESSAAAADPENLAVNQHWGATIVKKVPGYGEAEFTCISNAEPYYFVHVSKNEYTAKEMDAMDYQKNKMAVDRAALDKIAGISVFYAHNVMGEPAGWGKEKWTNDQVCKYIDSFNKIFGKSATNPDEWADKVTMKSSDYWIREANHDYPYAHFESEACANSWGTSKVVEDNHHMYLTTSSHCLMFYTIGHNAQSMPQKYKLGDTVKKTVNGYGEVTFTCVSNEKPYYFVYVSDRKYSAAEMDKMGFQQNEYAITYELADKLSERALEMADQILSLVGEAKYCTDGGEYFYEGKDIQTALNIINPIFKIFYDDNYRGLFRTPYFWVKDANHSYPSCMMTLNLTYDNLKDRDHISFVRSKFSPSYLLACDKYLMFAFKVE